MKKGFKVGDLMPCADCGTMIIKLSTAHSLCPECKEAHRKATAECKNKVSKKPVTIHSEGYKPPEYTLAEVNQAARNNNMSYGQYVVAWREGAVEAPEKFPKRGRKRGRKNGTAQERTM